MKKNYKLILVIIWVLLLIIKESIRFMNHYIDLVVTIFIILIMAYITWIQLKGDKKIEELQKENNKLKSSLKKFNQIIEKVNFGINKSYDEQFIPIYAQMKEDPNRKISILNYTETGFPDNYSKYLVQLYCNIIKNNVRNFQYKEDDYLQSNAFIDWTNIITDLQKIINKGQLTSADFKRYFGLSNNKELEKIIIDILDRVGTNFSNRDKYLLSETYWLIPKSKGDNVTRMYFLDFTKPFEHLSKRFLFACASIINGGFSSRYQLALLPANINTPYSINIKSYQVLHGLSTQQNAGTTPQSWVFSGIKLNGIVDDKITKLDYMFFQCKDSSDSIIGTKASQTAGYLSFIWKILDKSGLVLFDEGTLYLKRICELASLISIKAQTKNEKQRFILKFSSFINEIKEISDFFSVNINNNKSLPSTIESNSIWKQNDIEAINEILSKSRDELNSICNQNI